jgi:hypothetical protein
VADAWAEVSRLHHVMQTNLHFPRRAHREK